MTRPLDESILSLARQPNRDPFIQPEGAFDDTVVQSRHRRYAPAATEATVMAISPARLAANRRNSQLSTGPRTLEGKARSSLNAMTHGLRARQPLLLDEDPAEYHALAAALREQLDPKTAVEEMLVDEVVGLAWRLRRAARVETALYAVGGSAPVLEALRRSGETEAAVGVAFASQAASFAVLSRYETALASRLKRALADLERLQKDQGDDRHHLRRHRWAAVRRWLRLAMRTPS